MLLTCKGRDIFLKKFDTFFKRQYKFPSAIKIQKVKNQKLIMENKNIERNKAFVTKTK
jgi:hypothetical protein